jgi:hypothetical protein
MADKKITYSALPKKDMDNIFSIMESMADLLIKMSDDTDMGAEAMLSAREAAGAIRLKSLALQMKVQIL